MPKYVIITKNPTQPEDKELYENEVDCDNVILDTTAKFLLCVRNSGITVPGAGGSSNPIGAIVRWFNTDYVIECLMNESKVLKMLDN
jgi:hypothetical protein